MSDVATKLGDVLGWRVLVPDHRAATLASCIAAAMLAIILVIAHFEARFGLERALRDAACAALPAFSIILLATGRCRPVGVLIGAFASASAGLLSIALCRLPRARLRFVAPAITAALVLTATVVVVDGIEAALFGGLLAGFAIVLAIPLTFLARTRASAAIAPFALIAAWVEVGTWVRYAVCPHCLIHTLFF